MNKKGQTGFEVLLIALIIISLSTLIAAEYLETHQDTMAVIITRTELIKQLSEQEIQVYIESITLKSEVSPQEIEVILSPKININTTIIEDEIKAKTNLQDITVTIKQLS